MNAILIGAPGAGKGTQADILTTVHGMMHVASGDLLREAGRQGTELGLLARQYMDRGELVPDDVVIQMILEKLAQSPVEDHHNVIFDGFPRTLEQARALESALAREGETLDVVLYLDVPQAILMERLTKRYQCSVCGAIYNWGVNPPKVEGICDRCEGGLYQRMDDNERTVAKRLATYFRQTLPLIEHYEHTQRLHRIDGDQPISQVTEKILDVLGAARHAHE
jgi:adenylate kinase